MTKNEFINEIVGCQYVNRGYAFDGCDCWGLVYLYFKEVLECVPSLTNEYLDDHEFTKAFHAQLESGEWEKVGTPSGGEVVFMMYNGDIATHCGVMIDSINCLHALGDPKTNKGQTVVWEMSQVKRFLRRALEMNESPRVEFYKWRN